MFHNCVHGFAVYAPQCLHLGWSVGMQFSLFWLLLTLVLWLAAQSSHALSLHLQQPYASSTACVNSPFQPPPCKYQCIRCEVHFWEHPNLPGLQSHTTHTRWKYTSPPYDLAIARAERRQFRDTSGTLITPRKETAAHNHCIDCVVAVEPNFVPLSLYVPTDIYSRLLPVDRQYHQ